MPVNIKWIKNIKPWVWISITILIITIFFSFFLLPDSSKKTEEQKKAIEEKIEKLKIEENWTYVIEDGRIIEKKYYDGEILIAVDLFDSKGTVFRRDFYDSLNNNHSFASDYYKASKVDFTQYYDSKGNVIKIVSLPWLGTFY